MDQESRKVAVAAIKEKLHSLLEERKEIDNEREALDQRLRRNDIAIMDSRAAARFFDIEVEIPDELAIVRSIMMQRSALGHRLTAPPEQTAPPNVARRAESVSRLIYGGHHEKGALAPAQKTLPVAEPSVREIVIADLRRSHPEGKKARDLRATVERILKKSIHDKTVGMTLYRLSKDNLVKRDGQVWFYTSANSETKGSAVSAAEP